MTHRLVYYDGKRPQAHVANLVVDTDTGNVGINSVDPSNKLEVREYGNVDAVRIYGGGGGKDILKLTRNDPAGDPTKSLLGDIGFNVRDSSPQLYFNEGSDKFAIGVESTSKSLRISSNSYLRTEDVRATIKQTGEVGIGTTDPSVKLHVKGEGSGGRLILESVEQPRLDLYSNDYGSGLGANVNLIFQQINGFANCFSIRRYGSGAGKINVSMDDDGTNVLNLKANNVGIGTTDPLTELHVEGEDTISAKFKRRNKGGSGDAWSAVEIVTSNPTGNSRLVLNGPVTEGQGQQSKASCTLDYEHATNVFAIYMMNSNTRRFKLEEQGNVAIDTSTFCVDAVNDRVGIRTLDPVNPLDVTVTVPAGTGGPEANSFPIASFRAIQQGSPQDQRGLEIGAPPGGITDAPVYLKVRGTSNRFGILNDSNVENFTILDNGRVGIGTSDPQRFIHISSDFTGGSTFLAFHRNPPDANVTDYGTVLSFRNPAYTNHEVSNDFTEVSAISSIIYNSNTDTDGGILSSLNFYTMQANDSTPRLMIKGSGTKSILAQEPTDAGLNNKSVFISAGDRDSDSAGGYIWMRGNDAADAGRVQINAGNDVTSDGKILLYTGGSERLIIEKNGNIGIGAGITPVYQLELSTDSAAKLTTATWTTTSDERVKSNVVDADLQTCYDLVKNLPLKRYEWNEKYLPNVEDRHMLGWIAQDVQKILPKSVKTRSKTFVVGKELETFEDFLSLDSDQIIKMLFGAVQKLQKEVEELKFK